MCVCRCFASVLWRCWVGGRKGIRPVKTEWWGVGMVVCLERGADLHMAQLMPLPLTVSCFSKIQIGFTFLVPARLGSPVKKAIKRVCVCVCRCGEVRQSVYRTVDCRAAVVVWENTRAWMSIHWTTSASGPTRLSGASRSGAALYDISYAGFSAEFSPGKCYRYLQNFNVYQKLWVFAWIYVRFELLIDIFVRPIL